jgi:hypothetical protein
MKTDEIGSFAWGLDMMFWNILEATPLNPKILMAILPK